MAKRSEISSAVGGGKEIHCVMFPEQYHVWTKKTPWDGKPFSDAKINIMGVEVKSAQVTGETENNTITKKDPLVLKCGVEIFNGSFGTTTQNRRARFCFRVDSVSEFNSAMKELSSTYDFVTWDISKIEVFNPAIAATLIYDIHNPNGIGPRLYLKSAITPDYEKPWEVIDIFEQQRLCNYFYDVFAACHISSEIKEVKNCAIMKRKEMARK